MFFLFEDKDGQLYDNPDSYILSLPGSSITWGTELKIHPIYVKGSPVYYGYQTIQVMFYHECSTSTLDGTYWITKRDPNGRDSDSNWYKLITENEMIGAVTAGSIIKFDMGDKCPKYFRSEEDLAWYITNIYPLDRICITDEVSLKESY